MYVYGHLEYTMRTRGMCSGGLRLPTSEGGGARRQAAATGRARVRYNIIVHTHRKQACCGPANGAAFSSMKPLTGAR